MAIYHAWASSGGCGTPQRPGTYSPHARIVGWVVRRLRWSPVNFVRPLSHKQVVRKKEKAS